MTILDDFRVHDEAFLCAVDKIVNESIVTVPFPHVYVTDIFPSPYYQALLDRIATVGQFVPSVYPGVGVDLKADNFRDYGLTCSNFQQDEQLSGLYGLLKSDQFARTLLSKFSASDSWGERGSAIPQDKHVFFKDGRSDFTTVLDLHKDMAGYEISPHPDVPTKIVTFLFYFTPNDDLREYGTLLCTPRPGKRANLAKRLQSRISSRIGYWTRSLTGAYGLGQRDAWFPWELFDVAKVAEARPNSLLVFAPNSDSYHAVRMNIPRDRPLQERLTLRGFIRCGKDTKNYISEYSHKFGRKVMFRIARHTGLLN